ncbi:hypothetical protein [Rhizobium sp. S163]|uniref:hypothetical protein n=1 Tax=Rhizobium sp. S163 TaxID=3055039 RepID=UPI0025A9D0E7|nr:hypothetical protein [Rhizobium sp. S163]MDM9647727.1 hypothetical protein [Rhizobium sp. S163]
MNTVVSFRDPKMPPKPVVLDSLGEPMSLFTFSFDHDGREFCFDLAAYSWGDAEQRLSSLLQSIRLDGEIHATGTVDFLPPNISVNFTRA